MFLTYVDASPMRQSALSEICACAGGVMAGEGDLYTGGGNEGSPE